MNLAIVATGIAFIAVAALSRFRPDVFWRLFPPVGSDARKVRMKRHMPSVYLLSGVFAVTAGLLRIATDLQ